MRYNPATDQASHIDVIASQCDQSRKGDPIAPARPGLTAWGQLASQAWGRWKRHGAGSDCSGSRSLPEELNRWHAAAVVEAMGDRARAKAMRRQLAGLL